MARLWTCGFEVGGNSLNAAGTVIEDYNNTGLNWNTGGGRNGGVCLELPVGTGEQFVVMRGSTATVPTLGTRYYTRQYIYWPSADSGKAGDAIWQIRRGGSNAMAVSWGQKGVLGNNLKILASADANSYTGPALSYDTWYCLEVMFLVEATGAAGELAARLDGTVIFNWTGLAAMGTTAVDTFPQLGSNGIGAVARPQYRFDDLAINDTSGASQTSWPGLGDVRLLSPASDNARVGWTDAQLGTTSLFDAADNTPPLGTADLTGGLTVRAVGTAVTSANSMTTPSNLVPTIPAGAVDGDLLLCFAYFDTGATTTGQSITLAAWTDLGVDFGTQGTSQLGKVFYATKSAGLANPTVVFTGATTGTSGGTAIAAILSIQGADTSSPLGESGAALAGSSDTTTLAMGTGSFTLTAGRLLFAFGGKKDDGAANVLSGDGLTWTERLDSPSTSGADAMMLIDTAAPPAAGTAITNKTATLGSATAAVATSAGRLFSIKPGPGIGPKSHLRDAVNNATDTYDANLESYTTGGLGSNDVITLVYPVMSHANGTAVTARNVGQQVVSNPAIAETTHATNGSLASYTRAIGTVTYAPSPTLGTQPVMRIRKATATTDALLVQLMGLMVESVPGAPPPLPHRMGVTLQGVNRAATG